MVVLKISMNNDRRAKARGQPGHLHPPKQHSISWETGKDEHELQRGDDIKVETTGPALVSVVISSQYRHEMGKNSWINKKQEQKSSKEYLVQGLKKKRFQLVYDPRWNKKSHNDKTKP